MNKEWVVATIWAIVALILILVIGWCVYVVWTSTTGPGSDMPLPTPDQVVVPPDFYPTTNGHDIKG